MKNLRQYLAVLLGPASRAGDGDMTYKSTVAARIAALGCIGILSAFASAFIDDAKILIDRALNSPTLTVRYTGASASVIELRVNGISLGTRTVNAGKSSGETNFNLDLATLADGDNDIEVRLFDKNGKLIGTQRSTITTDDPSRSPVRLLNPKVGATITGPIEIKVGFGKELRNSYVSFFVNNQFRSMTNLAPYTFVWDTTREPNGWHELEAWVVDENSTTYKTRKTRVFVNNPSGQTNRRIITPAPKAPVKPEAKPETKPVGNPENIATGANSGLRNAGGNTTPVGNPVNTATAPGLSGVPVANPVNSVTGAASGLKPSKLDTSAAAGAKLMTPTLSKPKAQAPVKATVKPEVKPVMKIDAPVKVVSPKVDTPIKVTAPKIDTAIKVNAPSKVDTPARVKIDAPAKMVIKVSPPKVSKVIPAILTLSVTKGAKVNYSGPYTITFDSKPITFDVQPRVTDGVPLTPIRHLIEGAGGEVKWEEASKSMTAFTDGREIYVRIGDKIAKINNLPVEMEIAAFLEKGRTMVPLSFIRESLEVEIQFDPKTGHVLITSLKKKS